MWHTSNRLNLEKPPKGKKMKHRKNSPIYIKLMTDPDVKYMPKDENEEITAILDSMTEDDLRPGGELEIT